MQRLISILVSVLLPVALFACSKNEPGPKAPEGGGGGALTAEAQIEQGKQLYVEQGARAAGAAGRGTEKGPPVVGKDAFPEKPRQGAKRDVDFHTAADVFAWASKHMPGNAPGSLSTEIGRAH